FAATRFRTRETGTTPRKKSNFYLQRATVVKAMTGSEHRGNNNNDDDDGRGSLDDGGIRSTAKTIFERLSPYYDRVLDYATLFQDRYWKSWILRELPRRRDWRVLDLGCGTCVLERDLCTMGYEAVVGIDLTEAMLRIAL